PTEAVLTHPESGSRSESLKPWIWLSAVGGTLVTALSYSALRGTFSEEGWRLALADHALVGDSIAPLAALLSLGGVLAALYAIELQRRELEENRAVLVEQSAQMARTAQAQEDLATAQIASAKAQERANELTEALANAQTRANEL